MGDYEREKGKCGERTVYQKKRVMRKTRENEIMLECCKTNSIKGQ